MSLPVGPPLFLPNWHGLFDSIDRFSAGSKRVGSVRCARRHANRNVTDAELANPMDGCDSDTGMFPRDAFEHAHHLTVRQALVSFVVEPGHRLPVCVIADDTVEDANPAGCGVLDGSANFVERNRLGAHLAKSDRGAAGNWRKNVHPIAVTNRLRGVHEVTIDCQSHALEERRQRWKSAAHQATQLVLRQAWRLDLEGRARAAGELLCRRVEVNIDLHQTREV